MTLVVVGAVFLMAALAALGRPALTLSVLLGSLPLLPATMVLPGSPTAALTSARVVELGALIGALRASRSLPRRFPHVLVPFLVYAGVACILGLAFASTQIDPVQAAYAWLEIGEQVLVAVVVLILMRRLSSSTVLLVLALMAGVASVFAVGEWLTESSWSRFLLVHVHQTSDVPSFPLQLRNGHVRVRVGLEYALAFGWFMTALVPATVAAAMLRERLGVALRAVLLLGIPAAVVAVYLTRGRSPLLVALVLLVAALAYLAPRRPAVLAVVGATVIGAAFQYGDLVLHKISPSVDQTSVETRVQRLPHVLELAAAHPFRGTGLTGVQLFGPGFVDSSYLQVYVETGAIAGVLLIVAMLAPIVATSWGGLVGAQGDDRLLAVACAGGMAGLAVGTAFFDAFTTLSTGRLFWILAVAGVIAAERAAGPLKPPSWRQVLRPARLALLLVLVGIGVLARASWPGHATVTAVYETLPVQKALADVPRQGAPVVLATTLCQAAREGIDPHFGWRLTTCEELAAPGWVRVAVTGTDRAQAEEGLDTLTTRLADYPGLGDLRLLPGSYGAVYGIPTVARVAPWGLAVGAVAMILLTPGRRRATSTSQ